MKWRTDFYVLFKKVYGQNVSRIVNNNRVLRYIKNSFFRKHGKLLLQEVYIKKSYLPIGFSFIAPITIATKAKERGVENTLIKNIILHLENKNGACTSIDIGANFGYVSLSLARTVSRNGKVFAFEPNEFVFQTFTKSINKNLLEDRITAYQMAVGNTAGKVFINSYDTTSNLLKLPNSNTKEVEIISIDSVFYEYPKIDLIKIDIDGLEADVLEGARNTINKHHPIIVVEANSKASFEFFNKLNYKLYDLSLNPINMSKIGGNFFAIPIT